MAIAGQAFGKNGACLFGGEHGAIGFVFVLAIAKTTVLRLLLQIHKMRQQIWRGNGR